MRSLLCVLVLLGACGNKKEKDQPAVTPPPAVASGSAEPAPPATPPPTEPGSAAKPVEGSAAEPAKGSAAEPAKGSAAAGKKGGVKPADQALMDALGAAGVEWQSGAGKEVLLVENLECKQNNQEKPSTYSCTTPKADGKKAQAIIAALNARNVKPAKEHGDVVTFKVASVRCRSLVEGDSNAADACEVTP